MNIERISHQREPRNRRGFTLIEIMIVVVLVGMLAGIAVPTFARARSTAQRSSCIHNLRQIDGAKQEWALETQASADSRPTSTDLLPYFRDDKFPSCPADGVYRIRRVSRIPVCNQPGHDLMDPDGLPD